MCSITLNSALIDYMICVLSIFSIVLIKMVLIYSCYFSYIDCCHLLAIHKKDYFFHFKIKIIIMLVPIGQKLKFLHIMSFFIIFCVFLGN